MTYDPSAGFTLVYVSLGLVIGGTSLARAAQKSQDPVQQGILAKISKAMFLATLGPSLGVVFFFVLYLVSLSRGA